MVQGFRKIDADKWEFANEAFLRGNRHLLRNIQRRKSTQSQQIVSSSSGLPTEAGKTALEGEIERLRNEKRMMMQEVIELQKQQSGTRQHMEAVNGKLQAAEQRQKQMVSFLAKVFQTPSFLARLQQEKDKRAITSPRTMRRFVKHTQHEPGSSNSPMEGRIMKYITEDPPASSMNKLAPLTDENFSNMFDQDVAGISGVGASDISFQAEPVISNELSISHEFPRIPGQAPEEDKAELIADPYLKGKSAASIQQELPPEYFISFPEELTEEKDFHGFSSPVLDGVIKEEAPWNLDFGAGASSNDLWGNYEMPDFGDSSGLSDMWDFGTLQVAGSAGLEHWPSIESPSQEHNDQYLPRDDSSK
ncbi:winged helix/forkhead transcription factor [Lithospermum erythrorhizon]|uniref:Winged helix/forkhead transcription factor n=1 Tax=Lithospermum erythrorhizon TaxID=34254 RepID=A0AAV3RRA7_LITER